MCIKIACWFLFGVACVAFVRIQQILRAHRIPTNSAELMQVEALPREWRCHMLASLYIVRSDETLSRVNPVTDFDLWIVDEMCAPGHLVTDNPRKLLRNHKKQWERIVLFHRVVGILHVLWHTLHLYRLEEQRLKQACGQVWKAVVQNTPRTLRELLPTLMTRLIAPQQQVCCHISRYLKSRTMTSMTSKQIGHHGIQLIQPKKGSL